MRKNTKWPHRKGQLTILPSFEKHFIQKYKTHSECVKYQGPQEEK